MRFPSKEAVGLTLFFILLAASLAVVLLAADELPSGAWKLIRYIVNEMESFVVGAGALAYSATEGGTMIAEAFLKKREQKGREDGIEIGRRETHAAWRAWYNRWQAAQQRGEPFDEPPPKKEDDQP